MFWIHDFPADQWWADVPGLGRGFVRSRWQIGQQDFFWQLLDLAPLQDSRPAIVLAKGFAESKEEACREAEQAADQLLRLRSSTALGQDHARLVRLVDEAYTATGDCGDADELKRSEVNQRLLVPAIKRLLEDEQEARTELWLAREEIEDLRCQIDALRAELEAARTSGPLFVNEPSP